MKKVLIVEDDADTLDLIELILQDAGYAVIKVNREVSIAEIAAIKPHLVILDFLLPFMLGTELCLAIKRDPLTKHIPVILYSASSHVEKLACDSQADAHIAKPFDVDKLISLVGQTVL